MVHLHLTTTTKAYPSWHHVTLISFLLDPVSYLTLLVPATISSPQTSPALSYPLNLASHILRTSQHHIHLPSPFLFTSPIQSQTRHLSLLTIMTCRQNKPQQKESTTNMHPTATRSSLASYFYLRPHPIQPIPPPVSPSTPNYSPLPESMFRYPFVALALSVSPSENGRYRDASAFSVGER